MMELVLAENARMELASAEVLAQHANDFGVVLVDAFEVLIFQEPKVLWLVPVEAAEAEPVEQEQQEQA